MSDLMAPDGKVWVCHACGKRSKDKYGDQTFNRGWDASCVLNSYLYDETALTIEDGRVVRVSNPTDHNGKSSEV